MERSRFRPSRAPAVGEKPRVLRDDLTSQSDQPAREGPVTYGAIERGRTSSRCRAKMLAGLGRQRLARYQRCSNRRRTISKAMQETCGSRGRAQHQRAEQQPDALGKRVAGTDERLETRSGARVKPPTSSARGWTRARFEDGPVRHWHRQHNWNLKNVQLVPYTWQDEVTIMRRELERSHASLKLERSAIAKLPQLVPVATRRSMMRSSMRASTSTWLF